MMSEEDLWVWLRESDLSTSAWSGMALDELPASARRHWSTFLEAVRSGVRPDSPDEVTRQMHDRAKRGNG